MRATVQFENVAVDQVLFDFVNREVMPDSGLIGGDFWPQFANLIRRLTPLNQRLLEQRDHLQAQIDAWHRGHAGPRFDPQCYRDFLHEIGYLIPSGEPFRIGTANVDPEIARIAGPQLVVPVNNSRYALNAANARWGSLYDALYGTDAIAEEPGSERWDAYNPVRGAKVVAFGRAFLDAHFPLSGGSHGDAVGYRVALHGLEVSLNDGTRVALIQGEAFVGYQGQRGSPKLLLLKHHGLHVEIHRDATHAIGRLDAAGISDVVLEAAVTTIQDCEDSVAAVSTADKVLVYRNWLGLMKGTLEAQMEGAKAGMPYVRRLHPDRRYETLSGVELVLPGRSLMWVRNVGHHMLSDAMTLNGKPIPETFIDAVITALIAMHDLRPGLAQRNSRCGSVYIVKPKMHGPEEVAFADRLFGEVEDLLGMRRHTLKIGIMDEERRTSANLTECIRAARQRVAFINTGFLDRTGDEIHTSMEAAPMVRKGDLKQAVWLDAYERQNVDVGLACGLPGCAQIGKGMWAMPDLMAAMMAAKIAHPRAGAGTAWVPSPTAAILHALHYHQVDVAQVQAQLAMRPRAALQDILTPPLALDVGWSAAQIEEELCNNAQSILGYVVRWIDFGVGCSKVPDYFNVGLMEDRATLRISSQHVANWLHHGVCTREQVMQALRRMARVVDAQNAADSAYIPMSARLDESVAFKAACDLLFKGREQANGYTESILHARRKEQMAADEAARAARALLG